MSKYKRKGSLKARIKIICSFLIHLTFALPLSSALDRFAFFPYSGGSDLHSIPLSGCVPSVDFFLFSKSFCPNSADFNLYSLNFFSWISSLNLTEFIRRSTRLSWSSFMFLKSSGIKLNDGWYRRRKGRGSGCVETTWHGQAALSNLSIFSNFLGAFEWMPTYLPVEWK